MKRVEASEQHEAAVLATEELLSKLKLDHAWVGGVAISAWLGLPVESGAVDVLALLSSERRGQVPMMASNRGFRVDRAEIEASEELDLIPMRFGDVRIHVLMASNALYAKMLPAAATAMLGDRELRVVSSEDLALMLTVAEDEASRLFREQLLRTCGAQFDVRGFNEKLISIGLRGETLPE